MKKLLLISLSLFMGASTSFSQSGNLKIGPNLSGARDLIDYRLHDNELSVMTSKGTDLNYWKLSPVSLIPSSEAKPISAPKSKALGMVANSDDYRYFGKVALDKKDIVFYLKTESKDKTTSLFYQDLDQSFKPVSKTSKLASRSTKGAKTGLFNLGYSDGGGYDIKTNRKKDLLVIINQGPRKKVEKKLYPGEVTLTLYSPSDMKEISSSTYDLGIDNYGGSAVIGDDGIVYSLVYVDAAETKAQRKEMKKNGEATWYYKIMGINLNEPDSKPFESDIIFKNKGILRASLEISESGELICAGTYSELTKKGNIDDFDGIFYAKLNTKTGEIISDNQKKLDRSTVEFMTTKRNAKKNEGVSTSFKIRGYVAMANNTSNLILEEDYFYVVTTTNSKGQTTTTYHYVSKAILVANIASDGEINWIKHIPKHQHTTNDNGIFNSFTFFKDKSNLKFIFADNDKNYDPKTFALKNDNAKNINSMSVSTRAKSVAMAEIDASGKVEQKLVAKSKSHLLLTKYASWAPSGNELYIQASKRMSTLKCLLGVLFPPYGCYLYLKGMKPNFAVARLELD
ncbi:MAG: hypothetical protein ACK46S_12215 [Bacteroidota bacterium]